MEGNEIYEYKLNSGQNQQILYMKEFNNKIIFIIEKLDGSKYASLVSLQQLKEVSPAFQNTYTLNQALVMLNEAIESGNIFLIYKNEQDIISLKIIIKGEYGQNFPPIIVNCENDSRSETSSFASNQINYQENDNDCENLFKTETGLIIFRNGLLKSIVHTYSEIDDVVSKIQDIIAGGAKFKLLYRASVHGDKASIFHQLCDNFKTTLVLVETNKGVRFGGFTTKSWGGYCKKKYDKYAFVFNIDNKAIYEIKNNEPAIGCYPKFGPAFLGCQIRIYDNFFIQGGTTCHRGLNYYTNNDFELNNGEQHFIVKDMEIYGIESVGV